MKHFPRSLRSDRSLRARNVALAFGGCITLCAGVAAAQTGAPTNGPAEPAAPAAQPAAQPGVAPTIVQLAPVQPILAIGPEGIPQPPLRGEVTTTTDGTEVVVQGAGWRRGDHVEFSRVRPSASGEAGERDVETLGVGEVRYATSDHARVTVPVDVRVPVGAVGARTMLPSHSYPLAPPRLPGVFHVGFDARAFLPLGVPASIGVLGGVSAMYRFDAPIAIRAMLSPAGFVTTGSGSGTASAFGFLTLDTPYFEVGLGAGGMTTSTSAYNCDATNINCSYTRTMGGSFSLGQFVRIGSIDGLMVQEQTEVYIRNGAFELANINGMLQVPLSNRWWIQVRGGGGAAGYAYGEAVVRHLVRGNGDRGSLFVSGTVGGAGIGYADGTAAGPSVGANLEWRL